MRARGANYREEFGKLGSNYNYTMVEMLVVIKAYDVYKTDLKSRKPSEEVGWLDEFYDIPDALFYKPMQTVYISNLREKAPDLWETRGDGMIRLSAEGLSFLENNTDLVESASEIVGAVTQMRRV